MTPEAIRAGKSMIKTMDRHSTLVMHAYVSTTGGVLETESNMKAVDELCRLRICQRDDREGLVRLRTPVRNMLHQGLSSMRLQMVNANIGQSFEGILVLAKQYRDSKRAGDIATCDSLIQSLRDNVFTLYDDLADQSRDIWLQINSDFSVVTRLSAKIALNVAIIGRVKHIQEALSSIDMDGLYEICRRDRDLMGSVYSLLQLARQNSLKELGDAIGRLTSSMFNLKRLEQRGRNVTRLSAHYRTHPDFVPSDYPEWSEPPSIFLYSGPVDLSENIDIKSESLEVEQAEMISGLRKDEVAEEEAEPTKRISAQIPEDEPEEFEEPEFNKALRELFVRCIENRERVSVMDGYDPEVGGDDPAIWMFAALSEYAAIEGKIKDVIRIEYIGEPNPVFTGNLMIEDLILWPL